MPACSSILADTIASHAAGESDDFSGGQNPAPKADVIEKTAPERGGIARVRLSGGQRQRIGIASALNKRSEVIILDKATSALDNYTEAALIAALEGLSDDVTVIMVAHRLTTLRNCEHIIEIADGQVKRSGRYAELIRA
ncbi:ATP-binding cassette domain-containing protein [Devosia aurantiaca]|uniref:ATP-binding cassette domain-containing protein n=1 Tax=Devosia aurantiaca TaxID=2714858 RepID=A0A6M1ST20_9HYPH|nr:ATP-binding cassette domain-containing protein [Devosia aurantiaca]NGP18512.1 ATP-binding cassette domain-containing protein [Devosia aurantiaca]